jgi:mono/diheme cytochrome c family protein
MPPMGLSAEEIADVMNYMNHSWGNTFGKIVTVVEVSAIK